LCIATSPLRLSLLVLLAAVLAALFVPLGGSEPSPSYTVVRGDSLSVIARREGVSVAQLRSWNGIDGDLIEVGQALVVGPGVEGTPWTLAQWLGQRLAPEPQLDEPGPDAAAADDSPASGARRRKVRARPRRGGDRMGQGSPVAAEPEPSWQPLSMPAAKPCLADDHGLGEGSFGRSLGLDAEQVTAAVSAFQQQALRCYEGRESAQGEVLLELSVGCDGRVRESAVKDDSTAVAGFAACVAAVMRHAPFPAHARDEVELLVPMHFVADTRAN